MEHIKSISYQLYHHNVVRYVFVGGTSFIIDLGLLLILHGKLGVWLPLATAVAYIVSLIYNFALNRWWTFNAAENNSLSKHLLPYLILFSFNLLFTVLFVSLMSHVINYAVAKIIAVVIQTSWTYFGYKYFVFK